MKYRYSKIELQESIKTLATGEEDIHGRLISILQIIKLNENDFPVELREDWTSISTSIKNGQLYLNTKEKLSSIQHEEIKILNESASKIAEMIFNLYINLQKF
jgi:hypothetical protein